MPQPAIYHLVCHGCEWHTLAPRNYDLSRLLAKFHQQRLASEHKHVVEFVPAESVLADSPIHKER